MRLEGWVAILSGLPGAAALIWNFVNYIKEKIPKLEMSCPYSALVSDRDIETNQEKKVVCIQVRIANFRNKPLVPYWNTIKIRLLTTTGWKSDFTISSHITPPKITNQNTQVEGYVGLGKIPYFSLHDMTPIKNDIPYVRLFPITVDSISNLQDIRKIEFKFQDSLNRSITVRSEVRIINLPKSN